MLIQWPLAHDSKWNLILYTNTAHLFTVKGKLDFSFSLDRTWSFILNWLLIPLIVVRPLELPLGIRPARKTLHSRHARKRALLCPPLRTSSNQSRPCSNSWKPLPGTLPQWAPQTLGRWPTNNQYRWTGNCPVQPLAMWWLLYCTDEHCSLGDCAPSF